MSFKNDSETKPSLRVYFRCQDGYTFSRSVPGLLFESISIKKREAHNVLFTYVAGMFKLINSS